MDPLTVFIVATAMMMLNGGVLGLIHRDLPHSLRPSAVSWRIGTLLSAGGSILIGVQDQLPQTILLPLANGMVLLGITAYWRGLRQFYGRPDRWWMLLPVAAGAFVVWFFAAIVPDLAQRVVWVSLAWLVLLFGSAAELRRAAREGDPAASVRVLMWICLAVALFMLVRAGYFLLAPPPITTLLDFRAAINVVTPLVVTVLPVIGTTAFLLLCSDRMRRQWERAASTDDLTGLPNRRILARAGAQRLAQLRSGSELAVAVLDIDHFKRVNDGYGHDVGDRALCHVATVMRAALPASDLVARQGGEEFVALLDVSDAAVARQRAQAICDRVRATPFVLGGSRALNLTVSLGVAIRTPEDTVLDDLLRRADQALYRAKDSGRDRVEVGDEFNK